MKRLLLLILTTFPLLLVGQTLHSYVESLVENEVGAAVLVIKNDKILLEEGFGINHLEEKKAISSKSNFRVASVSKQFTAMAILKLIDDGKLSQEDTLEKLIEECPDYAKDITLRELIHHTSGLPDYGVSIKNDFPTPLQDDNVLQLLYGWEKLDFKNGTSWEYSNTAYVLLGLIVEKISGQPFHSYVQKEILDPLGMNNSCFYVRGKNKVTNRVYGHSSSEEGWELTDQSTYSALLGDGGLYTSISELKIWLQNFENNKLLSPKNKKTPFEDLYKLDEPNKNYGYGIYVENFEGHKRYRHNGLTMGFRASAHIYPDDNIIVVVLVNTGADAPMIADKIARHLFEK